ncbi:MAG TPA: beta-propeller fold lactonase family protein [Candidatus Solibacter sp.]|nr:beta-propeller fold lactonase family protein [Candidatus Solibacter sp.]
MLPRTHLLTLCAFALLALAGCGTSSKVCNLAACCGAGADACPVQRYLFAAGLTGQVSAFPVVGGGALGSPVSVAGPAHTLGMAALNNQFLYVSDFQNQSVDEWSINPSSGVLTPVPGSPLSLGTLNFGAGLATNSTANIVYVGDVAKIDAFKADATGALSALSGSPFPSGSDFFLVIDPQSRFLFGADVDPPGGVDAFTIDSTGALTAVAGSPFPAIPNFVGNTMPNAIVVDSTGRFVYLALGGTGQIAAFSIITPSGALNPVPGSPFAAGNTPLTMVAANNFLYVSNALDGTLSGYSIAPTTGILTPLSGSPFQVRAAALATDPAGAILYASGATGIMAFTVDASGGLTPIAGSPFPGGPATVLTFVQ